MRTLRTAYLILANTIVLFFLVLVGAHVSIKLYHHARPYLGYSKLPDMVKRNYSHMTAAEVNDLLSATWSFPFQYAPWVGSREGARESRFVNVDRFGRRSNGGPSRAISTIQDAIWFLGGSTTFGYGVKDEETIPAQVEKITEMPVINFGTGYFYSAQENILLVQYLKSGYRPKAVLFLDGINETCDIEAYLDEMTAIFSQAQREYDWDFLEIAKPVIYGVVKIRDKLKILMDAGTDEPGRKELVCEQYGKRIPLRTMHAHNLAERNSICSLFRIKCLTFVQPFAGVHGKHMDIRRLSAENRKLLREKFLHLEGNWRAANSEFVTDALDQHVGHAYIDDVHYSASASKLIAQTIAARIPEALR